MTTAKSVRDAFHYLYPDELPALFSLAQSLPPNPIVVNIGAGSGTSGLAFLESRPDLRLITIDIEDGDSPHGSLFSERKVFWEAGFEADERRRWIQVKGDSKRIGELWPLVAFETKREGSRVWLEPIEKADMVFVDGDHSYEGCVGDIRIWKRHLRPGGILAIHDYNKQLLAPNAEGPHPKPWPGVNDAVDDFLLNRYPTIVYVDSLIAFRIGETG